MIGALATLVFFAITPVFANRAAQLLGSLRANFWRLLGAAMVLGAWAHLAGRGLGGPALPWFVLGGVVGFGVGGVAMFQSLPRIGSTLSTLIVQCLSAIVAATAEWMWLGTKLSLAQIACAGLTLTGVVIGLRPRSLPLGSGTGVPTVGPAESTHHASPAAHQSRATRRAGVAWAILSAFGQGFGAVISRKAFAVTAALNDNIDPGTAAYQRVLGGIAVAAVVLLLIRWFPDRPRRTGVAWPWVGGNALTGPILGVTCYQWALRTTPAGIVQPIVAAAPLLTIPFAAWLEGTRPRPMYYVGAVLAVVGVSGLMVWR